MAIKLVPYGEHFHHSYECFSRRVGGSSALLPYQYYGQHDQISVNRHILIDADNNNPQPNVVGAITIKEQNFVVSGSVVRIAVATYPISLGHVDPKYALSGTLIFKKLLEEFPLNIMMVGNPSENTTSSMCRLLGWSLYPIPYLFRVQRIGPLVKKKFSKSKFVRPLVCDVISRIFGPPIDFIIQKRLLRRPSGISIKIVFSFEGDVNLWWSNYAKSVGFSMVRDMLTLNAIYPNSVGAFERLVFQRDGNVIGYAVVLRPNPHDVISLMGANVNTLIDFCVNESCLDDASSALSNYFLDVNADAIIVNHSHALTLSSLENTGFQSRITNMYFAVSPGLSDLFKQNEVDLDEMIVSRADGDGPIGLGANL